VRFSGHGMAGLTRHAMTVRTFLYAMSSAPIRSFALAVLILLATRLEATATSVTLPPALLRADVLSARLADARQGELEINAIASGASNIGPVLRLTKKDQPGHQLEAGDAYAVLQASGWVDLRNGNWLIGYGSGRRDAYEGNRDAGQLWIDLHADQHIQTDYYPAATSTGIAATWYGVGRRIPFSGSGIRGSCDLFVRCLVADDLLMRSAVGEVHGESFSGMMHTVSSELPTGSVRGRGWCVDARSDMHLGPRWDCSVSVEGLLGAITWRGVAVEYIHFTSPGVFEDPEGFLHDFFDASGAEFREDSTMRLAPTYRLDLASRGHPNLLLAIASGNDNQMVPSVGVAWPQSKPWLPYLRAYPTQRWLELGAVGRRWQVRISADDWPTASPKHLEIAFSAAPVRF